jgi:hypothetical protein
VVLAKHSAVAVAFTSLVVVSLGATAHAASIEVYPGPGLDTYRSSLYTVEVFDGSNWIPAYVYGFTRLSKCHWHEGTYPTVNFLTFGTTGQVNVRATKIGGSITSIDVSPHSKNIPVTLIGGQAVLTLNQLNKVWITINGDDANPLFIFADPPKPPVPPGAKYVGPGILTIPQNGGHYQPKNGEIIYLDGGAWVRGNIDVTGTRNVQIMGPGVLSGDLWTGEDISAYPYDIQVKFAMVTGDSSGDATSVSGITILDGPSNGIWGGANNVSGVKMLSPWFYGTDAFPLVSHIDHTFCFGGDEVFMPAYAGYQGENMTVTSCFAGTSNNTVFAGGWWGFESLPGHSTLVDDIDIKTYNNDDWVPSSPLLASAFQVWLDNSDPSAGYSNQTYRNIRIEGSLPGPLLSLKNTVYPWGGPNAVNPPLGNASNIVFKNISLEGTQKYRSEIKGWDGSNGFHNVVLQNVTINGTTVNQSNVANYFDINSYVSGLSFGPLVTGFFAVTPCRVLDTRNPTGPLGGPSLQPAATRTFDVGASPCGIPADAAAISANLTVTNVGAQGELVLFPSSLVQPHTSAISFRAGRTRANNAIVSLSQSRTTFSVFNNSAATVDFIIDVNGFFR